jgi:nicotinate-nucleotide--dimethylbenzimidazole phosphoribosyltransferase
MSTSSTPLVPYSVPTLTALGGGGDDALVARLQHAIDTKTKPLGSLGMLEDIALRIGLIQQSLRPVVRRPVIIVFAGDHGIAAQGVSPFPQAVTAQMVMNFLTGGAAINALSRAARIELEVVDAGVATPIDHASGLVVRSVAPGTRDFSIEPAMSASELAEAMAAPPLV